MKNIPRIYLDGELTAEQVHYLTRVMRTDKFLAFFEGLEYNAVLESGKVKLLDKTVHVDPSGNFTFCFSPIKKIEDLISGVVQMGAKVLQPVITDRTNAHHINWTRIKKIIIENSEQSGRNSIPELREPIKFSELDLKGVVFGDERKLTIKNSKELVIYENSKLFIGPEGGFSDKEFEALDIAGAIGVSLGKTILRAEIAAVALCAKLYSSLQ